MFYFTQPPTLCTTDLKINTDLQVIKIIGLNPLKDEFIFKVLRSISLQQAAYQTVGWFIFEQYHFGVLHTFELLFWPSLIGGGHCPSHSVMSDSLSPHGLQPARLLCPWNSLGKNTRVGCHTLLQGIFSTQGSNPGLPLCRQILYRLSHKDWIPFFCIDH